MYGFCTKIAYFILRLINLSQYRSAQISGTITKSTSLSKYLSFFIIALWSNQLHEKLGLDGWYTELEKPFLDNNSECLYITLIPPIGLLSDGDK